MKRLAFFLAVAFLACQMPALAADDLSLKAHAPEHIPDVVVWRTQGVKGVPIARPLEELYVTLYNTGNLPVETYEGDTGQQVVTILRSEDLFRGDGFPIGIDSMLCDLNPRVCSRELVPVEDLADLVGHVGGYKASKGKWTNSAATPLVLPMSIFREVVDFRVQEKPKGLSGEDYVAQGEFVCEDRFKGYSCRDLVQSLNSHALATLEPEWEGQAILPFRRLTATIPTHWDANRQTNSSTDRFSEAWMQTLGENDPHVWVTKGLADNLVSWGPMELQSASGAEPLFDDQLDLLKAISHPFRNRGELPREMREPVKIGVLDNRLYIEHCDFDNNVTVEFPVSTAWPDELEATPDCGKELGRPLMHYNHGTHVVGLIAGGLNGRGIVGLNPHAKIFFQPVNLDDFRHPQIREKLVRSIVASVGGTSVINISWQYVDEGGGVDNFLDAIKTGGLSGRLVVASAGNSNSSYPRDDPCGIRPACSNLNNVISVVGLNTDLEAPALWVTADDRGSNKGDRFDIAAVAENVLSTAAGNYFGRLSGTSQAAPQVTAAASLIYSVYKYNYAHIGPLPAGRVKNRLMYTADLYPHLLGDVFSGRLNVERALAVADDRFIVAKEDDDDVRKSFSGQVSVFGVLKGKDPETCTSDSRPECTTSVILCKQDNGETTPVNVESIRRMYRSDETNHYVIFYNKSPKNRASQLLRITDCKLRSLSQQVRVETGKGAETFKLKQIRDFVSAMF